MVKIDLKDAYFAVPIHRDHQQWLRFHWRDQDYQFCCLPFGLSSAPRVFTKITRPNSCVAEAIGSEIDCLHRRFSPFSSLQGGSPRTSSTHDHCTASIGFLDQQREVHPSTLPGNRILRSDSSVSPPSSSSTPAQTANAKIQGPTAATQGCLSSDHYSKRLSSIYWDSQCCSSGDTTRSTILQVSPASKHHSQKQEGGLNSPALLTDCDREELK